MLIILLRFMRVVGQPRDNDDDVVGDDGFVVVVDDDEQSKVVKVRDAANLKHSRCFAAVKILFFGAIADEIIMSVLPHFKFVKISKYIKLIIHSVDIDY